MNNDLSYADYRKFIDEISFLKFQLNQSILKKKEAKAEYKRNLTLEKELRDKLLKMIPDRL